MNLFAALAKHGTAVVAGFLAGIIAVAVIEPATTNGKALLLITVMCVFVLLGELVLFLARLARKERGGESRDGGGSP